MHVTTVMVLCVVSFIKGYHWSKFQLHSILLINSLLSNINDNGDNNENTKHLFRLGIFWVQLCRGKLTRGNLIDGIFRDFPDAIHIYVSGCIKSVYRYLVKIISDFRGICVLDDFYILVNST